MRRQCRNCMTLLRTWETRCPCCRGSAVRWLHLAAFVAVSLTAAYYLLVVIR